MGAGSGLTGRLGPLGGEILRLGRRSPAATVLAVAVGGSTLFLLWGLFARDATQIPLLCAGLTVYGLVFIALAVTGAAATLGAARRDEAGRAFLYALLGGLAALAAAGSLGVAIVLALVWGAG